MKRARLPKFAFSSSREIVRFTRKGHESGTGFGSPLRGINFLAVWSRYDIPSKIRYLLRRILAKRIVPVRHDLHYFRHRSAFLRITRNMELRQRIIYYIADSDVPLQRKACAV